MKEITYKISIGENGQLVERQEVNGFLAFDLFGYQWAVHLDNDIWIVSEVATGFGLLNLDDKFTKEEVADRAKAYLFHKGEVMVIHHVEKARMKIQEYETIINQSTPAHNG